MPQPQKTAAGALEAEAARADEIDDLRRRLNDLDRHKIWMGKNHQVAARSFQQAQRASKARENLARRKSSLRTPGAPAVQDRSAEDFERTRRSPPPDQTDMAVQREALAAAKAFEDAEKQVGEAIREVEEHTKTIRRATRAADQAHRDLETAERNLSLVQALHLASKLTAGEPCPICSWPDHPAPVTGDIERAGFRSGIPRGEGGLGAGGPARP